MATRARNTTTAPEPVPTQGIVADWLAALRKRPPEAVVGQVAKQVKAMLAEGIDPDDLRAGLAAWASKGLHPSALPSVVNEVMNGPQAARPSAPRAALAQHPPAARAIQTRYAGHRFRSRLEARWAVFFDHLGIAWKYEAEGYDLPSGPYLPDFYVTDLVHGRSKDVWVEVKGATTHKDTVALFRRALELPAVHNRPWLPTPKLLVLGDLPEPGRVWTHYRIDAVGTDVVGLNNVYFAQLGFGPVRVVVKPAGECVWIRARSVQDLVSRGWPAGGGLADCAYEPRLTVDPVVDAAYAAARGARFEHGEVGR